jgi:hypothetical protein
MALAALQKRQGLPLHPRPFGGLRKREPAPGAQDAQRLRKRSLHYVVSLSLRAARAIAATILDNHPFVNENELRRT